MISSSDLHSVNTDIVKKMYWFDNTIGYRWGFFIWLGFWGSNLLMLSLDDTQNASRDYAGICGVFSSLSLLYYSMHHWAGNPASTPAQHAILAEVSARFTMAAYLGLENITSDNILGIWNVFQLIFVSCFAVPKLFSKIYINFRPYEYQQYEKDMKSYLM